MSPQAAARISRAKKTAALPIIFGTAGERMDFHADAVDDSLNGRIENSTSKSRSTEMTRSAFSGRVTGKKVPWG